MSSIANSLRLDVIRSGLRRFSCGVPKNQQVAINVSQDVDETVQWNHAKPFESIPGPKPLPIPYFGNFWRFSKFGTYGNNVSKWQSLLRDVYGDVVRVSGIGRSDMILIYNPSDIEKMHRNESAWPIREGLESAKYYQEHFRPDIYGDIKGLTTAQGKKWHEIRSAVNPTMMQPRRTKVYVEPIESIADEFIERIKKIRDDKMEMPSDFANELNKWSLESIAYVALDTRLGCLADNPDENCHGQKMISAVLLMFECFFYLDVMPSLWRYVSTRRWRTFVKTMNEITDFAYKRVNEKIEMLKNQKDDGNNEPKSVLEALLKSGNPKFATIMAMDMLIAGIDTTANGVATILSLLATNPEKQEKLFNELKTFLPNKDSRITGEMLEDMKYLKATVKEAFRMKPVAPGNMRTTVKDLVIGGYRIPKGNRLISVHHVITSDEKHFKHAHKFIPERWLKSEAKSDLSASNVNPFAYLPFGFGTRMCIGRRFAEMEMEVIVAKIIRQFQVSYHYGEMEWNTILLTRPSKPLTFRMEDRPN